MNKEKVCELAMRLRFMETAKDVKGKLPLIMNWLAENQPEPVGLSDEQSRELHAVKFSDYISYTDFHIKYFEWAKTQSFSPVEVSTNEYNHLVSICDNLELQLKSSVDEIAQLKSQQFTPNWYDTPPFAVELQVRKVWIGEQGNELEELPISFKRPKPTPEVGQVWQCLKTLNEYVIQHLGITKIGEKWVESVTYIYDYSEYEDKEIYTRTLSDFLDKFEQVQS